MAERVRVREITNDEGNRLLRTVRRSSGSLIACSMFFRASFLAGAASLALTVKPGTNVSRPQ